MDNLVQGSCEGVIAVVEYDYKAKEVDELDLVKGQIIHNITQQPGGWWEGTLVVSGKIGMFPDNFVRVLDNIEDTTVVLRDKSSTFQRRCKAIYSYTQVNEDELTLAAGDVIEFLGEVEEGWWRGKLNNKIGVFPSNFVVAIQASPVFATKRPTPPAEPNTSALTSKAINTTQKLTTNSLTKIPKNCTPDGNSNNRLAPCFDAPSEKSTAPVLPPRPVREFCRVEFPYSPQNDDELELVVGELIAIVNKELADKGWWKGEVNGKIGVFPDNFVKLLPLDESPVKEIRSTQTDCLAKINAKKGVNSIIPNTNRVESFGSRDSLDDILNETGLQSGNVAAQRKSLENKNLELNIPSTSADRTSKHLDHKTGDTRKSIENLDEKRVPPPLLTKKPVVAGKKGSGVTNVAATILPGLKQKVKNVEQKHNISQDCNDGITSSKLNLESLNNGEKDRFITSDNDFDKVERGSILQDMRARRVKAPKRRPPSVAANLLPESIVCLNGDDSFDESKNLPLSSADSDEQIRPKSREWEKKKVPWMDELKASQVKKKNSPYIEPRTTLIDITTATSEEKQITPPLMLNVNISKNKKILDTNMTTSSQCVVTKTTASSSIYQLDNKIESETDVTKSISGNSPRDASLADESETKSSSKNQATKTSATRMQTQQFKSISPSAIVHRDVDTEHNALEGSKTVEFEKRIKNLEAIVQLQQKAIDEMQRMLRDESNRVELLKNQLEKYAQCVTQV